MGVIESADNQPTDQTYEVFKELSKALNAELQKKDATLKTELPRLNAAFQREKIEPVDPGREGAAADAAATPAVGRHGPRRAASTSGRAAALR